MQSDLKKEVSLARADSKIPGSHNPETLTSEDRPKSVLTRLISFSPHEQGVIPEPSLSKVHDCNVEAGWSSTKKYQYQKKKKNRGLDAYPLALPENLSNQSS
jgi:hypothetical protein